MSVANKALVRHDLEEISRGNLDILDEVISDDDRAPGGITPPAEYKARFGALRRAFPDIQVRFDALIAEDDPVALHCTLEGDHLGEWRGIPPTGKRATWPATAFRRVRDGKPVEGFSPWDWLRACCRTYGSGRLSSGNRMPRSAPRTVVVRERRSCP